MALSPLLQDAAALVTRENQRVVDTIGDKDPLPYRPLISINGAQYFPEPYSSPRLTPGQRVGMIPIASLGTLSVVSTLCLIAFILSRMINWKGHYRTWVGYNQYVVLVLSLLVADLVQGSGFVVSWFWIRIDMILAPSSACFAQGWLLHSGDISSGFFVLAIALHTYYTVVHGKRIGNKTFVGIVVGIWIWSIAITAAGVWMHGSQRYFTAAGSWCWVSPAFETERLWCHYVWIFAIEASTILIYSITFLFLRRKTRQLMAAEANYNNNNNNCTPPGSGSGSSRSRRPETATIQAVNRIARLMVFYPLIYLMLTLPLSAGRMWSMSRGARATGTLYTSIAGALLASCGWVDALLYTATRKRLLKDTMPSSTGSDAASHCCDYSNSNGEIHEECMFSSWNSTTTTEMQQMKQLQKGGTANPHHASLISDDGTIPTTTTTTPTNDFDAMTMTMKMMSSSPPSDRKEIFSTSTTASTATETETIPHELFERKQSQIFSSPPPPPPATAGAGSGAAARERTNSTEPMLSSSPSSASASTSRWGRSFSLSRSKSKSNKNWRMGMGMGRAGKTAGGSVDHQHQQQQQKKKEEDEIFCTTTATAARDDDIGEESFGGDGSRGNHHHHHQLPEDLKLEVVVPTMPLPVYLGEKFELGKEEKEEKRW